MTLPQIMIVTMCSQPGPTCVFVIRSSILAVQTSTMPEHHGQLRQLVHHVALLHVQQHSTPLHNLHQAAAAVVL